MKIFEDKGIDKDKVEWEKSFAWLPVKIQPDQAKYYNYYIWLEYIERRKVWIYPDNPGDSRYFWDYREIENV
jgi:hypothetical protein